MCALFYVWVSVGLVPLCQPGGGRRGEGAGERVRKVRRRLEQRAIYWQNDPFRAVFCVVLRLTCRLCVCLCVCATLLRQVRAACQDAAHVISLIAITWTHRRLQVRCRLVNILRCGVLLPGGVKRGRASGLEGWLRWGRGVVDVNRVLPSLCMSLWNFAWRDSLYLVRFQVKWKSFVEDAQCH